MITMTNLFNKTEKSLLIVLFLLLNLLLNLTLVYGLGVSPADESIYFKPNSTLELEFNIINSESNTFEANLGAYGEIKDFMFFENPTVQVNADAYRIPFKLIIKLPSEMEPGIRTGGIKITPYFETGGGGNLAAYVSPQIPIRIKVPYPSKYADITLVVLKVDEGTPLPLYITFDNLGSEDILKAGAMIDIYDPEVNFITNVVAPEISVSKSTLGTTRAEPGPILKRGLYRAAVKAYYDEFNETLETNFTMGDPLVRIKELLTKELSLNTINRVTFKVHSEWNTELSVVGFLKINGNQNEIPSFKLGKGEEKEATGFLDTAGLQPGDYILNITLTYADQLKTEIFPVTISEKAAKPEALLTLPVIIMFAILIFIILAVIAVLIIKKKKKEKI
jgi:hypothetical protein